MQFTSAEQAVSVIRSGNRVFIHSVAAAPQRLIRAMTARAPELRDRRIGLILSGGNTDLAWLRGD